MQRTSDQGIGFAEGACIDGGDHATEKIMLSGDGRYMHRGQQSQHHDPRSRGAQLDAPSRSPNRKPCTGTAPKWSQ